MSNVWFGLARGTLLVCLVSAVWSCQNQSVTYAPADSLLKGQPVHVPPEFQRGTATVEQAKAWSKAVLMGQGSLVTQELELIPGGRRGLFISDTSNAGTGGNTYMVFDPTPTGLRYLGDIFLGGIRAVGPDAAGRPRLVTYWHMGGGEGELQLWLLTNEGFKSRKSLTIHPGDGGTEEGNRIYDAFFGSEPVTEALIESTFGLRAAPPLK